MEYRWNIFLVSLDLVIGSEQGRTRPVLAISEEKINAFETNPIVRNRFLSTMQNIWEQDMKRQRLSTGRV